MNRSPLPPNPRFHMIARDELQRRLVDSARNVFSVLADIVLEEGEQHADAGEHDTWVTALIGLDGAYSGMVALHCTESLARRAALGLMRVAKTLDEQDMLDAMGEVVNIIAGDVKLYLDHSGTRVRLSLPSVFVGGRPFQRAFLDWTDTMACILAAGDEQLLVGVQVSRCG